MTLTEKIHELCAAQPWLARWFNLAEIAIELRSPSGIKKVWTTQNSDEQCPEKNLYSLGCSGVSITGALNWILFDLDVGHGREQYETTREAEDAGLKLAGSLEGYAEVRRSRGGNGVHVCWQPEKLYKGDDGPKLAKFVIQRTGIKVCRAPLGRQIRWLWCAEQRPDSFKLVEDEV